MMYTPDRWVVLNLEHEGQTVSKVLAGWKGGYLDGDSWKLNSGITKVVESKTYYDFHGESGSVYRCYKSCYGVTALTSSILQRIQHQIKTTVDKKYEYRVHN